jgi:hypothetical protein
VRDFDILSEIYEERVKKFENNHEELVEATKDLGEKLRNQLGFNYPYLDPHMSKYVIDLYEQTIDLGNTYYRTANDI